MEWNRKENIGFIVVGNALIFLMSLVEEDAVTNFF
jgi:hypothetical protein